VPDLAAGSTQTQASLLLPLTPPLPRLLNSPHRTVLPLELHVPVPASLAAGEAAVHV
jgi:hypothetical protein